MSIEERLERLERLIVTATKDVLNTREAAELLGISVDRLRHLICDKEIAYYKLSNRVYFKRQDLDNYRLKNRVASNAEIEEKANFFNFKHI